MAHEKGQQLNRLQCDAMLVGYDANRVGIANRLDVMTERAETAEVELERCRRALASARAILEVERDRVRELTEANAAASKAMSAASSAARVYRRNWEKASAMLRLLSPEQVAELREALTNPTEQQQAVLNGFLSDLATVGNREQLEDIRAYADNDADKMTPAQNRELKAQIEKIAAAFNNQ